MPSTLDIVAALGLGAVAGLGLVVPLGAIGVLIAQEGLERGRRRAVPAAVAVAGVDTVYCAVAVTAGAVAAPAITQFGPWPEVIGAIALFVVAAVGTLRELRPASNPRRSSRPRRDGGQLMVFVGLTAINPATLMYFAAIAVPMAPSSGEATGTAFVVGVGLTSLLWHLGLVTLGAHLGTRITSGARRITVLAGNLVVAAFGTALLVRVLW